MVPDQGAVEQFAATGLYPAFDDRVHPGHLNTAQDDLDADVSEDDVEQAREFAVPVADQESRSAIGALEAMTRFRAAWGDPCRGRMWCGAVDATGSPSSGSRSRGAESALEWIGRCGVGPGVSVETPGRGVGGGGCDASAGSCLGGPADGACARCGVVAGAGARRATPGQGVNRTLPGLSWRCSIPIWCRTARISMSLSRSLVEISRSMAKVFVRPR